MAETIAISADEYKEIRKVYQSLRRKLRSKMTEEDGVLLKKAYDVAVDGHKNQRRKSGEPYVFHPIEVARICYEEIGLGPTAVVSAILHDVVEDTPVTIEEIQEWFGPKICKIVDGLTKLDGTYNKTESQQAENFKKVLSTLVEDVRVVLIKMADRLHNLRTIGSMPEHKKIKIAAETSYIYIPLAHRLGLYQIKTEFQDRCLAITHKEEYEELVRKVKDSETDRSNYIKEFLKPLKKEFKEIDIPYRVLGRPKAISSIYNKIKVKNVPFEEIYDLFAVRIIADVPKEKEKNVCWQLYSIITDHFKPIPERLKDWVTTPKGNGYESLHTTVIGPGGRYVEVQIRTERMDDIAERGFAAHWKYKGVKSAENDVFDKWLRNIREVLDAQHADAFEFINDFKSNLFKEEIYVFTPTGDMRILPKGATALDFAFEIHSDVGYHATAIKVNNKLVPMGQILENGDQLHVTTQKNQKPSEAWLKMVITGKARSKVRSAMKEEKRKKGEVGKEALARKIKHLKLNFDDNIDFLVKQFGFKSRPDLYYALALGQIKVSALKAFKIKNGKFVVKKEKIVEAPADVETKKTKKKKIKNVQILVNGEPGEVYNYTFATCCQPVQGDPIFGFLNGSGQGLKIHRVNCPNATHLAANYGYRILRTEWTGQAELNFVVNLKIEGVDSGTGVIQELTNVISNKLGINIRKFNIEGNEGYFEGSISVFVLNTDQLNVIIKAIEKLKGVTRVIREN